MSNENEELGRYVVRGAKIRCTCGSHPRKFNLLESHGLYYKDIAIASAEDKIGEFDNVYITPGTELESNNPEKCNIRHFGICNSPYNITNKDNIKYEAFNENGKEVEPVEGKQCYVKVTGDWIDSKENVKLNGDKAINLTSYIACDFGGIIYFEDAGQENNGE